MLMTDLEIKRMQIADNVITPYFSDQLQPCSYDVTLSDEFKIYTKKQYQYEPDAYIDIAERRIGSGLSVETIDKHILVDGLRLEPGAFVIGSTNEYVHIPYDVAARFEGKSTNGRFGLTTHITAGFIDPGFEGNITLEIRNDNTVPLILKPGMRIGQLCFYQLDHPVYKPYGSKGLKSHYQGQTGPTIPA